MIKQVSSQKFMSECGKVIVCIENDMPVGDFHDFLLKLKGQMVDIMVNAQKEEEKVAEQQKEVACCEK